MELLEAGGQVTFMLAFAAKGGIIFKGVNA